MVHPPLLFSLFCQQKSHAPFSVTASPLWKDHRFGCGLTTTISLRSSSKHPIPLHIGNRVCGKPNCSGVSNLIYAHCSPLNKPTSTQSTHTDSSQVVVGLGSFPAHYNLQSKHLVDALNPERLTISKVIHQHININTSNA